DNRFSELEGIFMRSPSQAINTSFSATSVPVLAHDPAVTAEVYSEVARLGVGEQFPAAIALTREIFGDFTIDISDDPEIHDCSYVTFNVRSSDTVDEA